MTDLELPLTADSPAMPAKCGTCEMLARAPLVCTDCHQLLAHVQGADYFELFGLPRRFDLDENQLNRTFLDISRNIHPDRFAAADATLQSFALRASAAVNKAHQVLSNPHHRAEYLLESSGGLSASQDKRVPQDLLNQVLMLREEIEEAKAAGDQSGLKAIHDSVLKQQQDMQRRITDLCKRLPGDQAIKDDLRLCLNSVKYLENLLAQLS